MPRSANPVPQYFTDDNKALSGGKVYYFEAGTSTPKATYTDQDETILNAHPVILSASGRLPNVFFTGTAKQILKTSDEVQLWSRDNVGSIEEAADFNDWDSDISYSIGDIVKYNDGFYISLQNLNQNRQPDASLTYWSEIRFISFYNANVDYPIGTVVQKEDGDLWKGISTPNQGNNPSVDDGTNWRSAIDNNLTLDSLTVTGLTDSLTLQRDSSTVYARDDLVGTVSESGGLPTGAVIERGSNSNGQYTAFADGTLIMWTDSSIDSDIGGIEWVFPYTATDITDAHVTPTVDPVNLLVARVAVGELTTGAPYSGYTFYVQNCATSALKTGIAVKLTAVARWF